MKSLFIAIDFDGTCVTHAFPKIGDDIGAVPVLKKLTEKGHKLILLTMRAHLEDKLKHAHNTLSGDTITNDTLQEAIEWFRKNNIPLYAVNDNPSQHNWTTSPKVYADIYIDDAALGTPLVYNGNNRPYVDWRAIEYMLCEMDII